MMTLAMASAKAPSESGAMRTHSSAFSAEAE